MSLEQITANLTGKVRRETLHGREYLVAPLTLIVPGVLNGSKGPLMYTEKDIAENVDAWNGIPIVVNHPTLNGKPVSARDPKVLNQYGVGFIFSAVFNEKLIAEAWVDVEQANNVDGRIVSAMQSGSPMEVSTGLGTDDEPAPPQSTHNGRPFTAFARRHRPDHLAVLPDQIGACSIDDGCGLNLNKEEGEDLLTLMEEGEDLTQNIIRKSGSRYKLFSHSGKLLGTFDSKEDAEKREKQIKFFKHKNNGANMAGLSEKEKKGLVDKLVANCDCWKDEDRETLNEMDDRALKGLVANLEAEEKLKETEAVANAAKEGFKDQDGKEYTFNEETKKWESKKVEPKGVTTNNETGKTQDPPKQQTAEEWFENAPPEIQEVVRNAKQVQDEEKEKLIANLVGEDEEAAKKVRPIYEKMSLNELKAIAETQPNRETDNPFSSGYRDYSGASTPHPTHNRNSGPVDKDDHLVPPTINWNEVEKEHHGQKVSA